MTDALRDLWKKAKLIRRFITPVITSYSIHYTKLYENTPKPTDSLCCGGYGNPVKPVGLIVSSFRPSDDATILPFLIPSNYFAVTVLGYMAEISRSIYNDGALAFEVESLAKEVAAAIEKYAVVTRDGFGKVLAFEVDGFGNQLFMDDANIPSLLALPYLGVITSYSIHYTKLYDDAKIGVASGGKAEISIVCGGKDSVIEFYKNVLTEVMDLFPSKYIHIGGDEAWKAEWEKCPSCQKQIKEKDLKDEHGLQSYFIQQLDDFLVSKGRAMIGWDEILEGGLAKNATVMSWRGESSYNFV